LKAAGTHSVAFWLQLAQLKNQQNTRIDHNKALQRVMTALLRDDTELFKQFSDNESFRR